MAVNRKLVVTIFSICVGLYIIDIIFKYPNHLACPKLPNSKTSKQMKSEYELDNLIWPRQSSDWVLSDSQLDDDELLTLKEQPDVESCVWPEQQSDHNCSVTDRIINQLKLSQHDQSKVFEIAVAGDSSHPLGQELFINEKCPNKKCKITNELSLADVIIFPNSDVRMDLIESRRSQQIWIAYFLESPPNTFDARFSRIYRGRHTFNWTASYRNDSDIVTPYAKFVPYLSSMTPTVSDIDTLYAQASEKIRAAIRNKQTRAAWFVSNCHAKNQRFEFAKRLAKFIPVDIYGKCGNLTCDRWDNMRCLKKINRDYKFYLAFENSNSREYITEKFFANSLGLNDEDHLLVPIVMGPPPEDYQRLAPPNSFIHVDHYETVADLAKHLHHLGSHDALYYSYFRWKTMGRFVDTKFMCRVCAMAHKSHRDQTIRSISNIRDWWLKA